MRASSIIRGLAAGVLAATAVVGVQFASAPSASARCKGSGHPVTTQLFAGTSSTNKIAWEKPEVRCAPDGFADEPAYGGALYAKNGWTPAIFRQNGGHWYEAAKGRAGFFWATPTGRSYEVICARHNNTGNGWCGAGNNVKYFNSSQMSKIMNAAGKYGGERPVVVSLPWNSSFGVLNYGISTG